MFTEHNGHEFQELDEVTAIVRQNISDLRSMMDATRTIVDDNVSFVEHRRSEIIRMKEK